MYVPPHFREDRVPVLHRAMRRCRLATVVTTGPDGLHATHLPLLLDPEPAPFGTLYGHVARGNPHWQVAAGGAAALAIFMGPDAYVSPSWYPSKRTAGKVVPTWNYVTVHAHGPLQAFDEPARLLAVVRGLTEQHEAGRAEPWTIEDAPSDYIAAMLKGIVGLALPIARLEGKWKLSQNRSAADQAGVIAGLGSDDQPDAAAVAALMAAGREPD